MKIPFPVLSIIAIAVFSAISPFVVAQDADRCALHCELHETLRDANEALAKDDLHSAKKLHIEALNLRKELFPVSEYSDGHTELWESYAAVAEVMLDLDPAAGEAYCRAALRMRPNPKWRQSAEYASTLMLWGRYLDRLHEGVSGEKTMLAALRIHEEHALIGWSPYLSLCEHYLDRGDSTRTAEQVLTMYMEVFPYVTLVAYNRTSARSRVFEIQSNGVRNGNLLSSGLLDPGIRIHFKVKGGAVYIFVDANGAIVGAADVEADPTYLHPKGREGTNFTPPRQSIRFLNAWGRIYFAKGDFASAQRCFSEAAALGRFAFGKGRVVAESLTYLASAFLAGGDSQRALAVAKEASENLSGTPENAILEFASHCRLADVNRRLGKTSAYATLAPELVWQHGRRIPGLEVAEQRGRLGTCVNLGSEPNIAKFVGFDPARWATAHELRKSLNRTAIIAEARSMKDRGTAALWEGNLALASELHLAVLARFEKAYPMSDFPDGHHDIADTLHALATVYRNTEPALAIPYCERALAMRLKLLGAKHSRYASSLIQLGQLVHSSEPIRAESLFKEATDITRVGGAYFLDSMTVLGDFYRDRSEYAKAAKIYLEGLEHARRDPNPRFTPLFLENLGNVYASWGRFPEAEPYLAEAVKIRRKIHRPMHPELGKSLSNLAALYQAKGQFADALPLCQEVVAIWGNTPGGLNGIHLQQGLCALGVTHRSLGNLEAAEACLNDAVAIGKKAEKNSKEMPPQLAIEIAELLSLKGKHAEAARVSVNSVVSTAVFLKKAAASQPEQGQMNNLASRRRYLDDFISFALAAQTSPAEAYGVLMEWKCIITDGQRLTRLARTASTKGNAETKALFAKLDDVSRRYASQLNGPNYPEKAKHIAKLESEREEIEIELTRQTDEFRVLQRSIKVSPVDVRKAVPSDAVLIDFLSYARLQKGVRTQSYVAFIVSNEGIDWVDLGPAAPIDAAVADFRMRLQRGQLVSRPEDPGTSLRDKLWQPIAQKIARKKLVLLSPDRELCGLPFAALPTADGKRFLLEDVSLAVVSMPQLLPEMMAAENKSSVSQPSLLALGDVDFDGSPGRPSQAPGKNDVVASIRGLTEGNTWSSLPGTRGEVLAIESVFNKSIARGKCKLVRQAEATESLFCSEAPVHEYLHVATHGFFADAENKAAENRHPGLLSGIALAGANRPGTEGDDGILTALEVANLDLSKVKLAVLSACETGLGTAAGGEGVVGLQRAFQIAGAKTTVTSLWKVDDEATRKLMERFYENQWKKKLNVVESLREAQLWMLKDGRTALSESSLRGIARLNPCAGTQFRLSPAAVSVGRVCRLGRLALICGGGAFPVPMLSIHSSLVRTICIG
jgi:CHAT domain-containing protein/tetratricopeptide (TPR) repeat protein